MSKEIKHFYEFGPFRVDPDQRLLLRDNQPVPLQPKAFETLLVLVQHSERVVLKDDLMKTLWPDSFVEESNLAQNIFVLRKALGDTQIEHRYIVTLPGRGYRFAEKVRKVDRDYGEVVIAAHTSSQLQIEETKYGGWIVYASLLLLLAMGAAGYRFYHMQRHRARLPESASVPVPSFVPVRRSVAVLGFQNLTGQRDAAWLSTALSEMLSTELAAGEQLRIIPTEDLARLKAELPIADVDSLSKDTLSRVRTNLGSDFIVLGSYAVIGPKDRGQIRVDLRLQDASAGQTKLEVAETGKQSNLFDVVSRIGARLREGLGAAEDLQRHSSTLRASFPSNPEAARLYAEGLAKLRFFDALGARDLLLSARDTEPNFPLAHSALAEAWKTLGYDKRAQKEAKRALELSGKLSREDRLAVEGRYLEVTQHWQKAADIYKTLFTFFPDNLDHGLRLAEAQSWAGMTPDALVTLQSLRRFPAPQGTDPRIDLAEAKAFYLKEDWKNLQAAALRAAQSGQAQGERLLVARARSFQGIALMYLGDPDAAMTACQEAKQIYADAGNKNLVAQQLNNCGLIPARQGDLEAARLILEETLADFRDTGNQEGIAAIANNLCSVATQQGKLAVAMKLDRQALAAFREVGDKDGVGLALYNGGMVLAERGNLVAAKRMYEQALATSRAIDDKSVSAFALVELGVVSFYQDDLVTAKKNYEQSLALRQQIGEKQAVAETQVRQAELSLEEGRLDLAEKLVREAKNEFRQENDFDDEIFADSVLARVLVAKRQLQEAQNVTNDGDTLLKRSTDIRSHFRMGIAISRVLAASGRWKDASDRLQATLDRANKTGFLTYAMEARLALYHIEMQSGAAGSGRVHLKTLERDAAARGYALTARNAAALRGKS